MRWPVTTEWLEDLRAVRPECADEMQAAIESAAKAQLALRDAEQLVFDLAKRYNAAVQRQEFA